MLHNTHLDIDLDVPTHNVVTSDDGKLLYTTLKLLVLILAIVFLTSCGQKGALYFPDQKPATNQHTLL